MHICVKMHRTHKHYDKEKHEGRDLGTYKLTKGKINSQDHCPSPDIDIWDIRDKKRLSITAMLSMYSNRQGPIYKHFFTLIPALTIIYITHKVWYEITNPSQTPMVWLMMFENS